MRWPILHAIIALVASSMEAIQVLTSSADVYNLGHLLFFVNPIYCSCYIACKIGMVGIIRKLMADKISCNVNFDLSSGHSSIGGIFSGCNPSLDQLGRCLQPRVDKHQTKALAMAKCFK